MLTQINHIRSLSCCSKVLGKVILQPQLTEAQLSAAQSFAKHLRAQGTELAEDWLNNGPIEVTALLPKSWREPLQPLFNGSVLRLTTLGRADLLKTKLFALCDRGTDLADCLALAPTPQELKEAAPWLALQDAHPMWPEHVQSTLQDLAERLCHEL